jgi:hypothetical protein
MIRPRGWLLSTLAALMGVLALTNFAKPIPVTSDTGFVLFGERLAGFPSAVAGVIAGLVLLAYAVGIWRLRKWALPLGWLYAAYVVINSALFRLRYPMPTETVHQVFEIAYAFVAIGGAVGTAWMLSRRRMDLT